MKGPGSRVAGHGRLLRSLSSLLRRVERFGMHRAVTGTERLWSIRVADAVDGSFPQAVDDPGALANLAAAEARAEISQKLVPSTEAPW